MAWMEVTRAIDASPQELFETVSDIRRLAKALPHVVRFEFLTDEVIEVGTRFRETRLMGGKEMDTELEITELHAPETVRMVADTNGTIWDTTYTIKELREDVRSESEALPTSQLTLAMDARPYKLITKIMTPLIRKMVANAVERDVDMIKSHLESADA